MSGMQPQVGQVVTGRPHVPGRCRLRPEAAEAYAVDAPRIAELAAGLPGFVKAMDYTAPDGERVTEVSFADADSHRAWRDHLEHRAAQRRGVESTCETCSIQVGTTEHTAGSRA